MATLKRRALSALMALVLVLGLLPGGVLAYEGETDGSGTATITVVDEAGEPLEGITVSLYDRDSGDDPWSEEPVDQQTTDEDGQAVFTILQERSYMAHADGGDGEPTFRLDAAETEVSETIKLKASENDGESDPSAAPVSNGNHYNTTVTVRDASFPHSVIEDAQVTVNHWFTGETYTATTNRRGEAHFNLPGKWTDYTVTVTADGYEQGTGSVNACEKTTIYLSRDNSQSGDYTFRDTGSRNVKIYYSVGGQDLQEMTPSTSIQVDGSQPVMFFVGATDGSNPVTDFTDASDNQAKEIQTIQNAPSSLTLNNRSYNFSSAIQAAKNNGCTMEFHYSQFAPEYKTRTFCFVTDKTELSISYEWDNAPSSGVTLPADDTVTYGDPYTVDSTYSEGSTVTVGNTIYVFSGWTASNDEAWVSDDGITGTVKGNVVFSGSWTVRQQTYDAAFFLRIDREIQYEDGTTSYSSKDYLPEHQDDGTGHFWGTITGTAFVEGGEDSVVTDLTENELEDVLAKFERVSDVIVSAPSLTGTSAEDQRFQQMVLDNFAVTSEQLSSGEVGVLWYVAKEQDSSVCHHHVDGVLYNTTTGKPIQPKYKLTVTHEYYTYWMDGTTEKGLTKVGSSETVYTNETEKTVSVESLKKPSYGGNTYSFFESSSSATEIAYSQDGATITLKYKREVAAPELDYTYTFQYYYKALGQDNYTLVTLTPDQQTAVTTSVGPVSEYPTEQALWNSIENSDIPACPVTEYAGSYAKAAQYAEGEVTKNGTTYTIRVYLEQAPYQFAIRYQLFEVVNGTVNPTPVKTVTVSDNNNYGPSAPSLETVLGKTDRTYLDEGDSLVYARYDVYDPDLTDGQVSQSGTVGGTGAEQLTYTVNYYCASFTGGYLTISKTISGVPATDTAAWAELRELTFTVQKLVVTESADSFTGTVISRSEQWVDVDGLTDISITEFTGFESKNGTYTYTCKTLLPAGTYRVVEDGGDLSSLGYTWNLDGEDAISSEVTVAADGASKTASITNAYTGKTYTIIFAAGSHGQVQNQEGTFMEPGKTTEYHWGQVTPEERDAFYKWISAVKDGTGSTIRYTFTQNDYLTYAADMSIPAPGLKTDAGWSSNGSFYNGETAYTTLAAAYQAMNDAKTTSITYTANYTANEVTYAVDFYYQNDDGTYPTTPTTSVTRTADTGASVSVTDADKTPDATKNTATQTYHFDETASNVLTATVAGDGSTHLKVYFYWTAGVTYQYQPAGLPAAITEAYPLPSDTAAYRSGVTTTNLGAPNGTTVQTANGSWTLTWNLLSAPMTAQGVTYTGTWTFTADGQSTVRVQFVDENGNDLWALAHTEANPYTSTGDYESSYDFSAAEKETSFQINGLTYTFSKDYDGTFDADKEDQTVAYTGTLQPGGRTITRVYAVETQTVTVTKHYDIDALPGSFQVTITDNDANQAQITVLTLADATVDGRTATWQTALPKGHSYTFTESGFSNGSRWSTELTARWLQQVSNTEQAWQDLTVTNFSFVLPEVDVNTLEVELTNDYTYDSKDDDDDDDDDDDPVVIPDEDTPTTDLPDEETPTTDLPDEQTPTTEQPTTDLPDEETPMAEAPKTGDNSTAWILAAGVSGLALVWLAITGKKRRDNEHQA